MIVVGAERCGTSTMFRLLAGHPDLVRPSLSEGTGHFDDEYEYDRSPDSYLRHFLPRPSLDRAAPQVPLECSGYYLFHTLAAGRIAADLPGAHVVALLGDPVARAVSAHRYEVARGFETLDLEDALAVEGVRTFGETERLCRDAGYRSFAHRHHAYVQRGEYAQQARRFIDALGPRQVHVIDAGDFFADVRGRLLRLQHDLGLTPWTPSDLGPWNAGPQQTPDPEVVRRLLRHFEPHDAALGEILGAAPSWRRPERSW